MKDIELDSVIEGIYLTLDNCKELIIDAKLLLSEDRFSRSFSLAQLANEEVGKAVLLFYLYVDLISGRRKEINFKEFENKFRSHKEKTFLATSIDFMNYADSDPKREKIDEFCKDVFEEIKLGKNEYNILKNNSLYVGYSNGKFVSPQINLSKEIAENFTKKAELRYSKAFEIYDKEIKLNKKIGMCYESALVDLRKNMKTNKK